MTSLLTRRAIAFLLAVALAIVASLLVLNYVRSVESEAAAEIDAVLGYVATGTIEPGQLADTAIQLGLVEQREIPRTLLAPNAVTDLSQITGRVVQETIFPGDQLVFDRFAAPGQGVEVLAIPPGHVAMSISVGVPPGVAGFLREGDHVSILSFIEAPKDDGSQVDVVDPDTGAVTRTDELEQRAEFLLQDVEILAIGRRTPPTEEQPAGGTAVDPGTILMTVAVTHEEAEQLTFGALAGSLYITLLPEDETDPVDTPGRSAETLFDPNPS